MRAMSPVPVPMSRILLTLAASIPNAAHAPSNTPSVPTFMAHLSCRIVNLLKLNIPLFIHKLIQIIIF